MEFRRAIAFAIQPAMPELQKGLTECFPDHLRMTAPPLLVTPSALAAVALNSCLVDALETHCACIAIPA